MLYYHIIPQKGLCLISSLTGQRGHAELARTVNALGKRASNGAYFYRGHPSKETWTGLFEHVPLCVSQNGNPITAEEFQKVGENKLTSAAPEIILTSYDIDDSSVNYNRRDTHKPHKGHFVRHRVVEEPIITERDE